MITVTAKGTAQSKTNGTTLTRSSVAIAQDASVVVSLVHDPVGVTSVTWNGNALTKDKEETHAGGVQGSIWTRHNCNSGTGDVVVTFDSAIDAKAICVTELLANLISAGGRATIVTDVTVSAQGTGTAPASGTSAALTYPGEVAIACLGWETQFTNGGNSNFTNIQFTNTTGGVGDTNISIADYRLQVGDSTSGQGISNTSASPSADWVALVAIFYEDTEQVQDARQNRTLFYTGDRVEDARQNRTLFYTGDRVEVAAQHRTIWFLGQVTRDQTAKANIIASTSRTQTAKGNIAGATLQTQTAKGNIAGQTTRTQTAIGRIGEDSDDFACMF